MSSGFEMSGLMRKIVKDATSRSREGPFPDCRCRWANGIARQATHGVVADRYVGGKCRSATGQLLAAQPLLVSFPRGRSVVAKADDASEMVCYDHP
jgi:hypothetical protein